MSDITVPRTPGSSYEEHKTDNFTVYFGFEPDPEYTNGTISFDEASHSYMVGTLTDKDDDGVIFFSDLDEMEEFARKILAYVRRNKRQSHS